MLKNTLSWALIWSLSPSSATFPKPPLHPEAGWSGPVGHTLPCSTESHFTGHCSLYAHGPAESDSAPPSNHHPQAQSENQERESPGTTHFLLSSEASFHPTPTHGPQTSCLGCSTSTLSHSQGAPQSFLLTGFWKSSFTGLWTRSDMSTTNRKHSLSLRDRTITSHSSLRNTRKIFSQAEYNPQGA